MGRVLKDLVSVWKTILVTALPIVLLPLPIVIGSSEVKCAYGLILMAVFWITEALPIAVTSLLPVLIFPMFGVVKVGDICATYIKNPSMFVFGGLSVAVTIEKWNLHKRMALRSLLIFGSEPKWLLVGFMTSIWFLSMWINNIACTAMMLPIVSAVMAELKEIKSDFGLNDTTKIETRDHFLNERPVSETVLIDGDNGTVLEDIRTHTTTPEDANEMELCELETSEITDTNHARMCKGMLLCVAYASNIGGIGTLSGTGPNLVGEGHVEMVYDRVGAVSPVSFTSWMVYAMPLSLVTCLLGCVWLQWLFLDSSSGIFCLKRRPSNSAKRVASYIRQEYNKLGPMSFAEKVVLAHFILLVILWISRRPPLIKGWGAAFPAGKVGYLFGDTSSPTKYKSKNAHKDKTLKDLSWPKVISLLNSYVKDSAASILISLSLFVAPSERPAVFPCRRHDDLRPRGSVPSILDWKTLQTSFPWGVLFLFGGGYALADACEKSGLSKWIGSNLSFANNLDPLVLVFVLTIATALMTEITNNNATISLLLPIFSNLALTIKLNPLYLMLPCTVATSFAFMLPAATPPNAMVFATGQLRILDMVKAGIGMNIIGLLVLLLATNTWGDAFFRFNHMPEIFLDGNSSFPIMD